MAIKFQKHAVVNAETGAKCRVWYSYSNADVYGPERVHVTAKDYGDKLGPVLGSVASVSNRTDTMSDYFDKDRVLIPRGHALFDAAKARVAALRAS